MAHVNDKIPIDTKKGVGRPRGFEPDIALERAMRVFWEKGYVATSLDDLTGALGVNRPSIYATFGNKETLFASCLDLYATTVATRAVKAMAEAVDIQDGVRQFFRTHLACITGEGLPTGCFFNASLADVGTLPDLARTVLMQRMASGEAAMVDLFRRAQRQGQLTAVIEPVELAGLMMTLMHGLAVEARAASLHAMETKAEAATRIMLRAIEG
jgi:AcrR family transcriptional regulator